jgi:2,3-bisphosphoglycerate-dependent phosphoglycerate mutase
MRIVRRIAIWFLSPGNRRLTSADLPEIVSVKFSRAHLRRKSAPSLSLDAAMTSLTTDDLPPLRLCLVRHGETDWNVQRRYQGHIDIPLNAQGEAQARSLAPALRAHDFAAVLTSDLQRAQRTAALALAGRPIAVSPALIWRERNYGVFEGQTVEEARIAHPLAHSQYLLRDMDYDFETGESLGDFARRIDDAVEGLRRTHAGAAVLVFTHGGVLDVIYRRATGRHLQSARDFPIPNAGINWLHCTAHAWTIDTWGDIAHWDAQRVRDEITG